MKTYIIDWGENANGSRWALVQARNLDDAWDEADAIGSPFKIAEFKITPIDTLEGEVRYMEFDAPEDPFFGSRPSDIKFKKSTETGIFA